MRTRVWISTCAVLTAVGAAAGYGFSQGQGAPVQRFEPGGFLAEVEVVVPVDPQRAWTSFTEDLPRWWDHAFSGQPENLRFEARPGGGFVEDFDAGGDGARHATVTYVERGRLLRFVGSLGLSGKGIQIEHELTFTPEGDATRVHLTIIGWGRMLEDWPETVRSVWNHFLVERYAPYVRGELRSRG